MVFTSLEAAKDAKIMHALTLSNASAANFHRERAHTLMPVALPDTHKQTLATNLLALSD